MPTEKLVRLTYTGGWVSAGLALVYKILIMAGVAGPMAVERGVFPHHLWEMSFLLFLSCIATEAAGRSKTA